jgi:hypothetical protein
VHFLGFAVILALSTFLTIVVMSFVLSKEDDARRRFGEMLGFRFMGLDDTGLRDGLRYLPGESEHARSAASILVGKRDGRKVYCFRYRDKGRDQPETSGRHFYFVVETESLSGPGRQDYFWVVGFYDANATLPSIQITRKGDVLWHIRGGGHWLFLYPTIGDDLNKPLPAAVPLARYYDRYQDACSIAKRIFEDPLGYELPRP